VASPLRYFLLHKPYGVLCQFSGEGDRASLASFGPFPRDVYPAGRLDADSEGLVLLTNDNRLKHFLLDPRFGHERTYLVQVEGIPDAKALERLRGGIIIDGRRTRPARVKARVGEPPLPPRSVPIRFRKHVPTSWLELTLREGRNRQVRRMTAAVGYPTLRLVRISIGTLFLEGLEPGDSRPLTPEERKTLFRNVLGG
jgi:23S rRNA pseudouridine2457 synthase